MQNWEIKKKFEDCIENIKYTEKIPSKDFKEDGLFPIISQEEKLISGYWDNECDVFKISKPVVIFGDHTRVLKYIDFDFVLGADGVKILQPKDFLNAKFFMYFLQNANIKNLGYARHYRLLKKLEIPLPPLEEQKRIVSILDRKFAQLETVKKNVKTNLQNAKDLFQSQLTKAFSNNTWEKKRLGEVCTVTSSKRIYAEEQTESGIPFLRVSDLVSRIEGNEVNDLFISESKYNDFLSKRLVPKANDLLITSRGTLGLCYIVKETDKFYFQDGMITWLSLQKNINSKFLAYLFKSPILKKQIEEKSAGAAVSYISISDIRLFEIPLPPLIEQKRIIEQLDSFSAKVCQLETIYTKQFADCDELKQAFLTKAFAGEL